MNNYLDLSMGYKYEVQQIEGKKYIVNKFNMGQWICKNCEEIVLEDYTYEEDCGCCKPDLVMYQDWLIDKVEEKKNE